MVAPILSELILNRYLSSDAGAPSALGSRVAGGMCRLMLSNTSSRSPECAQCVTSPCDELACHKVWPFVEDIVSSWDGNMFLEVSHGHGKLQFLRPPQQKACNRPTRKIPVINSLQMQPDD